MNIRVWCILAVLVAVLGLRGQEQDKKTQYGETLETAFMASSAISPRVYNNNGFYVTDSKTGKILEGVTVNQKEDGSVSLDDAKTGDMIALLWTDGYVTGNPGEALKRVLAGMGVVAKAKK